MRKIKCIHRATYEPIVDLVTYRVLPNKEINHIDPFLFLNHHGPQEYPAHNHGLPFGPHPHRGFETVTFVLDGDIEHKDSNGGKGVIQPGGVQWMTAGRGLIHSETSSGKFRENGGKLEILQLWLNLPAKHKMITPQYKDMQKEDIPSFLIDEDKVKINLIAGQWEGRMAAYQPILDITLCTIEMHDTGKFTVLVPPLRNVFFYVVGGAVRVNGTEAKVFDLVEFENDGDKIAVEASFESYILFGHALPLKEPIVAQGPFVMNTVQEIIQADTDYKSGRMGTLR